MWQERWRAGTARTQRPWRSTAASRVSSNRLLGRKSWFGKKLIVRQVGIAEDLRHEAATDSLTRVNRHHCSATIRMAKVLVASPNPDDRETVLLKRGDHLLAG